MLVPNVTDAVIVLMRVNAELERDGSGQQVFTCSSNDERRRELGRYFITKKVCTPSTCPHQKAVPFATLGQLARAARLREFIPSKTCPCPTTITNTDVDLERLARLMKCLQPYERMRP